MNTSIDKIPSPQTRRFERGNKQLLLALASVSMLGFAGNVSAATFSISPPSSILPTDKQAFFKVAITGGVTSQAATVKCHELSAAGTSPVATVASGIFVLGVAASDSASYTIAAGTDVTANYPITLTLSGQEQGFVVGCSVSVTATSPDSVSVKSASLTIGAGAAAARLYAFDTTSQVTYDSTNQIYPAVPPQTSPRCVNIGLVAPNATNNPIKTLTVGSTTAAGGQGDYVASLVFFPSPDTAFGLSSTTGSSITSSLNDLYGLTATAGTPIT